MEALLDRRLVIALAVIGGLLSAAASLLQMRSRLARAVRLRWPVAEM